MWIGTESFVFLGKIVRNFYAEFKNVSLCEFAGEDDEGARVDEAGGIVYSHDALSLYLYLSHTLNCRKKKKHNIWYYFEFLKTLFFT